MTVPGYLLGDEWENDAFVRDCFLYNRIICEATKGIAAIWGNIDLNEKLRNEDGRIRKYNAAFFARDGKILGVTHKTLLPKYRGFDDERHFYPARKEAQDRGVSVDSLIEPFTLVCGNEKRTVGIVICEDMWSDDYSVSPVEVLLNKGADLIVDISCSPWTLRKNQKRHSVVQNRVGNRDVYFIYSNNVGIQDNGKNIFLFDGNSTIYGKGGSP
jgi:NAD+ synthase (glutamine-hydrolysing)